MTNSVIVMGGYLLSRVLGIVREGVLHNAFGTGDVADAYQAAFQIPDLLYLVIIGGALGSAFIPIFSELLQKDGEHRAWELASSVLTLALLLLTTVSLVVAAFAPQIVALLYPGFNAETQALTVDLMRMLLLSPLLLGLGGLAMATLNALDRFTLPALAPALYNLSIIVGTLLLAPRWSVHGTAIGVVAGALLYLLVQLPGLISAGIRFRPRLGLADAAVQRVGWLLLPRIFGQSAMQINLIVIASLASTLDDGPLRALGAAYQLMLLPHGIFALSLGTVTFPAMARAFAAGQLDEVGQSMRSLLRIVMWTVIPSAVMLLVLHVPIVRLFERGAFDARSTALVAGALLAYATALPAFAASEILIRTFYAMQDTKRPVIIGVLTVIVNVALAVLLIRIVNPGHVGLAAAFSIANNIEALLLLILIRRHLPQLDPNGRMRRSLARTLAAATALALALWGLLTLSARWLPWLHANDSYATSDLPLLIGWLALAGALGGAIYVGVSKLLGSEEVDSVLGRVLGRLRRRQST